MGPGDGRATRTRQQTEPVGLRFRPTMGILKERLQRSIDVACVVLSGSTFATAGERVGVSAERARQITKQALRRAARGQKDVPNTRFDSINDFRANKEWWLTRLRELESSSEGARTQS